MRTNFVARDGPLPLEWAWKLQAIESSLVESNWVCPKIACLASLDSRGRDSTQFGSRNFRAILIFRTKSSTIDWIDGTSIHSIPLYGTGPHSSHFSLGLSDGDEGSTVLQSNFIQKALTISTNVPVKNLSSNLYHHEQKPTRRIHLINKATGKKVYGNGFEGTYVAITY